MTAFFSSIGTPLDRNIVVAGLLSVDFYPLVVIEVSHDIFLFQIAHIRKAQSREDAEQEHIPVEFLLGVLQLSVHQHFFV